mmetsp:Transcript_19173/g.41521  ORF Transcript_19173/g.41521 Transcript_19173/m.41521 type:complete len:89 (+) Transcript_19173:197-463(+)
MSRRHVLEDSDFDDDDDDDVKRHASDDAFFTVKENKAIDKCDIYAHSNGGEYSEDLMSLAIARVREPLLEVVEQGEKAITCNHMRDIA